jgi:hypothetical protein
MTHAQVDPLYAGHLLQVELVQVQQEALLRCLLEHHGLRRVLLEGLTPHRLAPFNDLVVSLREEEEDLARLQQHGGEPGTSPATSRQVQRLLEERRRCFVVYGAATRIVTTGQVEALPLDDTATPDDPNQITADGKVENEITADGKMEVQTVKVEARHDAQVKRALASGPCSVLVLGGGHNLSASVRRLSGGTTEYVRVTTRRYKQAAGEK